MELQEKVVALAAGALLFAAAASGFGTLYAVPKSAKPLTSLPGITADAGKLAVRAMEAAPPADAIDEITGDAQDVSVTGEGSLSAKSPAHKTSAKAVPAKPKVRFPIDINTASADMFDALPGIGPTLAGRIIAHRKAIGRFKSIEQLMDVKGIGEKKFADMKKLVVVK